MAVRHNLQIGVAAVTWNTKVGGEFTVSLGFGMKPESAPPASFRHGAVNDDCVMVGFVDMKVNMTMSPTAASSVAGL